jgi:DNA polymerase-3 subunit gamma/tau
VAYTALYREWRPKTFNDVVGQEHITITLKNQILKERIAHAYLFCGTRGTGKTSTAKIFAKALNCKNPQQGEPCNECDMCKKINSGLAIDVTELDAASNNGVDNIRDIIDDVQYPPQEARFKIYIMDEVHMLSSGAVNAFLKTLEEPPKNVVFILATTDPQKLPITILSRCQRFDFKRIKNEEIYRRMRKIVEQQGVYADDNSLNLIARISDGAMRDALSILDQAISMGGGNVEYDRVLGMLGLVTNENLLNLTECIIDKNVEKSIRLIDEIILGGKDSYAFIKDLILHFRNLMIVRVSQSPEDILDMSQENIELIKVQAQKIRIEEIMRNIKVLQEAEEQGKWSKQSRIYLELAIIKMCRVEYDTSREVLLSRINKMEEIVKQGKIMVACETVTPAANATKENKIAASKPRETEVRPIEEFNSDSELTFDMVKKKWKDILETFKARRHMVLYASLMTGRLSGCSKGIVEIFYEPQYSFNKQRMEKEDNRRVSEEIFSEVLNEKVKIKYVVEKKMQQDISPEERLIQTFGEDFVEIIDE